LVARSEKPLASQVRRFLRGLSCDELQFIASFLGACILESARAGDGIPEFERRSAVPERPSEDRDLKMILLMEYLGRSGIRHTPIQVASRVRLG